MIKIFCYSPKHCFRLIEGQQYHYWSEKSPAVGQPPTLGILGRCLHHSSTELQRSKYLPINVSTLYYHQFLPEGQENLPPDAAIFASILTFYSIPNIINSTIILGHPTSNMK